MNVTALLPLKAHSQRVPGKNLRDFAGQPLFTVILDTLLRVSAITRVVVNTDSDEIDDLLRQGYADRVTVHKRPDNLRGDLVPMNAIIGDDLARTNGEHFLQTHATNPLLDAATLARAIDAYAQALGQGHDSIFSVTPLRQRLYDSHGEPLNHDPSELLRTQDLAPVYVENSCLYLFSRESFGKNHSRLGARPRMYEIDPAEAWDIDEPLDFTVAELLFRKRSGGS